MSKPNLMEIMNETVMNVLEHMAFVFPEPADMTSGVPFEDFEYVLVGLNFVGDHKGEIKMIIPVDFCAELSANLLGEEIGDMTAEENNFDAVKELLNIVSGQLLLNVYGEKALFSLINLTVCKLETKAFFDLIDNSEYSCCVIDDYPVITMFAMQEVEDECKSPDS
jgi:CheY-specific phosphatase CheX